MLFFIAINFKGGHAMWLIFILVMFGIVFAGLILWWIGSKVDLAIKREQKKFELEEAGYDETKKKLTEALKKEVEEKE